MANHFERANKSVALGKLTLGVTSDSVERVNKKLVLKSYHKVFNELHSIVQKKYCCVTAVKLGKLIFITWET